MSIEPAGGTPIDNQLYIESDTGECGVRNRFGIGSVDNVIAAIGKFLTNFVDRLEANFFRGLPSMTRMPAFS